MSTNGDIFYRLLSWRDIKNCRPLFQNRRGSVQICLSRRVGAWRLRLLSLINFPELIVGADPNGE